MQEEKEFLQNYEIKNWNITPRLYKFLAISALANILAFVVIGQTDLLTRKGCDSPFVNQICQVLDTVYVGTALFGTDAEFAIKDYEKTELADTDITYIDVSGETPPLKYPEGYFALANPEQFAMMQNTDFPMMPPQTYNGFPTNPTIQNDTNLLNTPQVVPTPNNNAITGTVPDSPFSIGGSSNYKTPPIKRPKTPKLPKIKNDPPKELPKLDGDKTTADSTTENKDPKQPGLESDPVTDFRPNKKPLQDFADEIIAKRADKQKTQSNLDLTKSFKVTMSGVLTEDGKLDPKKSRYIQLKPEEQGDQEMVDIAKNAIEAINDSGLFYYLKTLGVDKVDFTLTQDDNQIYAVITSSQKDENKAKTISSGFNNILSIAKLTVKEEELKTLLNAAVVEPKGKNFVLNFKLDKPIAQKLIEQKLQEAEAKKKEKEAEKSKQPGSTAQTANTNLVTGK